MSNNIHIASSKANKWKILAIWLILIILPFVLIFSYFSVFLRNKKIQQIEETKKEIIFEYEAFKKDLSFTSYFNSLIEKNNILFNNNIENLEETCELFKKKTNIQIDIAINYNAEQEKIATYFPSFANLKKKIPLNVLKNLMSWLGHKDHIEKGNLIVTDKSKRAESLITKIFKFASDLLPIENKSEYIISGIPELGKLLTVYIPCRKANNLVYGGTLLLVKERNISLPDLMKYAQSQYVNNNLIRKYDYVENYGFYKKNGKKEYEFHYDQNENLSLIGYPSEEMLIRLINKGTYYPFNIEEIDNKPLMLKITAPKDCLMHPLEKLLLNIKKPVLLFVVVISFFLTNILIFGYSNGTNIVTRLTAAIVIASFIPFMLFIFAIIMRNEYEKSIDKINFYHAANMAETNLNILFNTFIKRKEKKLLKINSNLQNYNFDELKQFISNNIENINAAHVNIYSNENKEIINIKNKKLDYNEQTQLEREGTKGACMFYRNIYKKINPQKKFNRSEWDIKITDGFKPEKMEYLFTQEGNIENYDNYSIKRLHNTSIILNENKNDPNDINLKYALLYTFNTKDLIKEFLDTEKDAIRCDKYEDYDVRYCFITLDKFEELTKEQQYLYSAPIDINLIRELTNNMSDDFSNQEKAIDNGIIRLTSYANINTLIITQFIKKEKGLDLNKYVFIGILIYYLTILTAAIYFLRSYFVKPIKLLDKAANKVKEGIYNLRIAYESGDEFEELTQAFNEMTKGLKQKEILSKYVNVSVLEEIEEKDGQTSLKPGGEKINASIVFFSLGGFDEYKKKHNATEIAETLGKLVDITDGAAMKYNGLTDKLIEDTLMVVFRQTAMNDDSYVLNACKTALEVAKEYKNSEFELHIGLSSGDVVSGKIGSKTGKLDYTVIGNPVNLAARLKVQAHKAQTTGILICPNSIRLTKGKVLLKFIERTAIKGRTRTFPLYELLDVRRGIS